MGKKNPQYQAFDRLVKHSLLTSKERKEAWRIFNEDGLDEAEAYLEGVESKHGTLRVATKLREKALPYGVWGKQYIDEASYEQMNNAMRLPISVAGALMPDAHVGYGLPIGGVLATEDAVIPYAVGVDIACRMMLTVYAESPNVLNIPNSAKYKHLYNSLIENTIFGAGGSGMHEGNIEHTLLDAGNWSATKLLRDLRKTAIHQIGTSGTGNHFVEWGVVTIENADNPLGLEPGKYLGLLSHSGSRGVGYQIAEYYSKLAMSLMPDLDEAVRHLAWLSLDEEAGQEYWHAMHLAGQFASANHHIIHERVARGAGLTPIASIENHHNFAWREVVKIDGEKREVIVHRKGATPAGKGMLGVIPGTMADTGYLVEGKGEPKSLQSASHGGGRAMSRRQAKKTISPQEQKKYLKEHGVTLIGGGLDEAPQAYKRIEKVIQAQHDLVDIVGTFQPRLVRMASDDPPWKRKAAPVGVVDAEGD
jgi:tRNA-splicing ligase RtcB